MQRISIQALAISTLLVGITGREARANLYGPISPNQFNWVRFDVAPGNYRIEASTLGDVDIALYDATRQNRYDINSTEGDGLDILRFYTSENITVQVKYTVYSCFNPWGGCYVDLKLYNDN